MATAFSDIIDIFMTKVDDYRLLALYQASAVDFETFLSSWLIDSVVEFKNCRESLTYNATTNTFAATLSAEVQSILATLMVKKWLEKEVHDVTQMNLHITDKDYKIYSESQNLREKSTELDKVKESCSQMFIDYGYADSTLWSNWLSGNYYSV